jgi:hypothetical protein
MNPYFTAAIAAIAAVFGFLGPLVDFLGSFWEFIRERPGKVSGSADPMRVTFLTTRPEEIPTSAGLRADRFSATFLLVFAFLAIYAGGRLISSQPSGSQLALSAFLFGESAFLLLSSAWQWRRLANSEAGHPLDSCSAELVACGTHEMVSRECIRAMINIGAIRSAGIGISQEGARTVIQGGVGAWGESAMLRGRGSRVTITIDVAEGGEGCKLCICSESFRAEILDSKRNRRNIRNIVRILLS